MTEVRPFDGVRVIDLSTRFSGAFAARLFGDFGAEVILVESPDGHMLRHEPPFVESENGSQESVVHAFANWNKQSIVTSNEEQIRDLVTTADIVVTTSTDLTYVEKISKSMSSNSVHLTITPYGLRGPRGYAPGNNLTLSAHCGWAAINGLRDEPPLAMPRNQHGIVGGVMGYIVAASSLRVRDEQVQVERIDVSEVEAYTLTAHPWGVSAVYNGFLTSRGPSGGRLRGTPGPLWNLSDGRMNLGLADFHNWTEAMDVCGLPEMGRRPELIPDFGRHSQNLREVVLGLAESLPKLNRWEVFHALAELRCVIGVVQDVADLLDNEHLLAREFFTKTQINHKEVHTTGAPAKLHPSPWRIDQTAPSLGATSLHDLNSRKQSRTSQTVKPTGESEKPTTEGPLRGIRVLSFAQAWSGTFATELLALLGADVVQIASTKHPDSFRRISNVVPRAVRESRKSQHPPNTQGQYNAVNLHKRELNLDLTHPKGQEILWQLIPRFDMLVENFRPTVLPRWGVSLEKLHEVRPGMIWASISGYGASGPYSHYPANGATTEPMAGLSSVHGYAGDQGMNTGGLFPDPICGYFLVATVLAALRHRDLTGEPQRIDLSMLEAVASTIGDWMIQYEATGIVAKPQGNQHAKHAPHNMYKCGEFEWLALAVESDEMWRSLTEIVDDQKLLDHEFSSELGRKTNEQVIDRVIADWLSDKDAYTMERKLNEAGICASRVVPLSEVYARPDPIMKESDFLQLINHPEAGASWLGTRAWQFSSAMHTEVRPAPCVGEHTQTVLQQELGISQTEYNAMVAEGITGTLDEEQTALASKNAVN